MRKIALSFLLVVIAMALHAADDPTWDNTSKRSWPTEYEKIEIPSSVDGSPQKAYVYRSSSKEPQPLIVSLHTWSGYYNQTDPLAREIMARDWNYIHPDFRGSNRTPQSMGSELALSDIEDAIDYAVKTMNVDPEDVHIVGVSGGGYATLAAYMNIDYPVKSFSAWAPISDIENWYWECTGRGSRYAKDILSALSADKESFDPKAAAERSPLRQHFPVQKRKDSKLYIYAGIHDGYKGSVPITHSINMYNRLVGELIYGTADMDVIMQKAITDANLVSCKEMLELLGRRMGTGNNGKRRKLFDREIHLARNYKNIHLTIFEGRHEQLPQALGLIPVKKHVNYARCNVLTIGDSNGYKKEGWVTQLRTVMPEATIINNSESGRAIGFDNNNKPRLNALNNIEAWLDSAKAMNIGFDYIVVCLGTNDAKKMFASRQGEEAGNLGRLLSKIKAHAVFNRRKTKLIYVTPPPLRCENVNKKYEGSGKRLTEIVPQLKEAAEKAGATVVDIHTPLLGVADYYAKDGVHMSAQGQIIVATKIAERINQAQP